MESQLDMQFKLPSLGLPTLSLFNTNYKGSWLLGQQKRSFISSSYKIQGHFFCITEIPWQIISKDICQLLLKKKYNTRNNRQMDVPIT